MLRPPVAPRLRINPDWVAQPGSQVLFLSSPVDELLFHGTRGNGKTDALIMDFAQHCGQGFGPWWRGVLFRQTYKQLGDVIAKSRRWLPRLFPGVVYNGSDKSWTWPTGECLLLRQARRLEDYDNYHGHEYPWLAFEELTNWPDSRLYDAMQTLCRSPFEGIPHKIRATCNPFGVGHNWVRKRFINAIAEGKVLRAGTQPTRAHLHGSILENKVLMRADPSYLNKLLNLRSIPQRMAWAFGRWDITAGGMFDDLWADEHILDDFEVPPEWDIYRAYDHGASAPFSVGWWAMADGHTPAYMADGKARHFPSGTLIRMAEWYGTSGEPNKGLPGLTVKLIAKGIAERETALGIRDRVLSGPADNSIFDVVHGKCIYHEFEREQVYFTRCDKSPGSRRNGWELCRVRLQNALDGGNGDPAMYCMRRCQHFIELFPALPRDPIKMDDVDTDSEDHIGDETRYMVQSSPVHATMEDM